MGVILNNIGKDFKVGSNEYNNEVDQLLGSDLDKWQKLRDGGSRLYQFKNGLLMYDYISTLGGTDSEEYGSVGFVFSQNTRWEVGVSKQGAFLEETRRC